MGRMEFTILALAVVLLLTVSIAWLVMAGAQKGGGPPDGGSSRSDGSDAVEERPPDAEPEIEIESEKLANRPR